MKRGEVWWADLPAPGRRPVVLLSRGACAVRELVTVAPVTARPSIPVEVTLGVPTSLPRRASPTSIP